MLVLQKDVSLLLCRLCNVTSPKTSSGRRCLQFRVTVAATSDSAESDDVPQSGRFPISRPHLVAVAEPSTEDDQSKEDHDADSCPWVIRPDSSADKPPSYHSVSGPSDGVPLLSTRTGEISDVEASGRSISRFDEEEHATLSRHSVSLDEPLQQEPNRFLHWLSPFLNCYIYDGLSASVSLMLLLQICL